MQRAFKRWHYCKAVRSVKSKSKELEHVLGGLAQAMAPSRLGTDATSGEGWQVPEHIATRSRTCLSAQVLSIGALWEPRR